MEQEWREGGGGSSEHEDIFEEEKNGYVVIKYPSVNLLQTWVHGEGWAELSYFPADDENVLFSSESSFIVATVK